MNASLQAVIFDSDGTLLDTRALIFEGYKTVLRNHGLLHLANDACITSHIGKPTIQTFEQLLHDETIAPSAQDLAHELDEVQNASVHLIRAYPHVKETLRLWKKRGIKLGLFTSGYAYMIDRNYAAAGMPDVRDIFDVILTADDHTAHKPEPDGILELLRRIDIEPSHAMAVGDHVYDIIAAKRAGIGTAVGILHGIGTRQELADAQADIIVASIDELDAHLHSIS